MFKSGQGVELLETVRDLNDPSNMDKKEKVKSNLKDLFYSNSRDAVADDTTSGKAASQRRKNKDTAMGAIAGVVTISSVSLAPPTFGASLLAMPVVAAIGNKYATNRPEKGSKVTKIDPSKPVKTSSEGIDKDDKDNLIGLQEYGELGLSYKDVVSDIINGAQLGEGKGAKLEQARQDALESASIGTGKTSSSVSIDDVSGEPMAKMENNKPKKSFVKKIFGSGKSKNKVESLDGQRANINENGIV